MRLMSHLLLNIFHDFISFIGKKIQISRGLSEKDMPYQYIYISNTHEKCTLKKKILEKKKNWFFLIPEKENDVGKDFKI